MLRDYRDDEWQESALEEFKSTINTCISIKTRKPHQREEFYSHAVESVFNAIRDYDPTKGATLRTHVAKRLHFILLNVRRAEIIRDTGLSSNTLKNIKKYKEEEGRFLAMNGRTPDTDEREILAREAGFKKGYAAFLNADTRFSEGITSSLDEPIGDPDGDTRLDIHKDTTLQSQDALEQIIRGEDKAKIQRAMAALKEKRPREYKALMLYFFNDDKNNNTHENVGKEMGVGATMSWNLVNNGLDFLRRCLGVKTDTPHTSAVLAKKNEKTTQRG